MASQDKYPWRGRSDPETDQGDSVEPGRLPGERVTLRRVTLKRWSTQVDDPSSPEARPTGRLPFLGIALQFRRIRQSAGPPSDNAGSNEPSFPKRRLFPILARLFRRRSPIPEHEDELQRSSELSEQPSIPASIAGGFPLGEESLYYLPEGAGPSLDWNPLGLFKEGDIKVVLAGGTAQGRNQMAQILTLAKRVKVVGQATNTEEAFHSILENEAAVLLYESSNLSTGVLAGFKKIFEGAPGVQGIFLTTNEDPEVERTITLNGFRQRLILPIESQTLAQAVERAYVTGQIQRERIQSRKSPPGNISETQRREGQTIFVMSPQGGVGCSLIATNLALALQSENCRVALLDLDPLFGTSGMMINLRIRGEFYDYANLPLASPNLEGLPGAGWRHPPSGLTVFQSPRDLESFALIRPERLAAWINRLKDEFDYLIIDNGSGYLPFNRKILASCNQTILLTTQDIPCLRAVKKFLAEVVKTNLDQDRITLVVNQYLPEWNLPSEWIAQRLERSVDLVIPFEPGALSAAINFGRPPMADPELRKRPFGQSIEVLADRLRQVTRSGR